MQTQWQLRVWLACGFVGTIMKKGPTGVTLSCENIHWIFLMKLFSFNNVCCFLTKITETSPSAVSHIFFFHNLAGDTLVSILETIKRFSTAQLISTHRNTAKSIPLLTQVKWVKWPSAVCVMFLLCKFLATLPTSSWHKLGANAG